jgi:hypothetical protein
MPRRTGSQIAFTRNPRSGGAAQLGALRSRGRTTMLVWETLWLPLGIFPLRRRAPSAWRARRSKTGSLQAGLAFIIIVS